MSALHAALIVDGETVGDLISIGNAVTFFAARIELTMLDGAVFRSIAEARQAVAASLQGKRVNHAGGVANGRRRSDAAPRLRGDELWLV